MFPAQELLESPPFNAQNSCHVAGAEYVSWRRARGKKVFDVILFSSAFHQMNLVDFHFPKGFVSVIMLYESILVNRIVLEDS